MGGGLVGGYVWARTGFNQWFHGLVGSHNLGAENNGVNTRKRGSSLHLHTPLWWLVSGPPSFKFEEEVMQARHKGQLGWTLDSPPHSMDDERKKQASHKHIRKGWAPALFVSQ